MIRSFRHKALAKLFETGESHGIQKAMGERIIRRLDVLHAAKDIAALNIPGFNFHGLHGKPKRYTIHVNGPWCITFEWIDGDAWRVDLEQYH
ncbi:MAG: plasmid maintenance system killer [Alphaproteobacteria bacterium]|nr:plasmid maintenance system killer [Alphaproteobacteria bacterium]